VGSSSVGFGLGLSQLDDGAAQPTDITVAAAFLFVSLPIAHDYPPFYAQLHNL
jgi:hypothetical protein